MRGLYGRLRSAACSFFDLKISARSAIKNFRVLFLDLKIPGCGCFREIPGCVSLENFRPPCVLSPQLWVLFQVLRT